VAFRLGMIVVRKTVVLVLDEGHQIHVVVALDDEDALAGVTLRVGGTPVEAIISLDRDR
jgi:hypothetical protein